MTNFLAWIRADWTHALVAVGVVLTALTTAWGAFKAAYARVVGHPLPRTRTTLALDVAAELATNFLGALNKILGATGARPLFPPTTPPPADTGAPLVGRPGSPGRASLDVVLTLLVVAVALAIAACHPSLPPVSGCAPLSHSCSADGTPLVCSASQRWEPAGDESCAATGQRCVVEPHGRAHCSRTVDGGIAADGTVTP